MLGRRRISQAQLARMIKKNPMWVSDRLRGSQPIDLNDLALIAGALDVNALDLLPNRDVAARSINLPKLPLVLSAHRDPPTSRHGQHVAISGSPFSPKRRDSTRPQSVVPPHRRRPSPTGPGVRPIPA